MVTNSAQSLRLSTGIAQHNNSEILEERFSGEYIVLTRTRKQRKKKKLERFSKRRTELRKGFWLTVLTRAFGEL